jgi:hypothetical protein
MLVGNELLVEAHQIVMGVMAADINASAKTGDAVSLKNYHRCAVVVHFDDGSATTGDITVTLEQMTDVANSLSDNKALNFTRIDYKQGTSLAAIGTFTSTTQTAANTYTSATSGESEGIWVIDIQAEDLDLHNNFDCMRANLSATSSTKIAGILYILSGPKFGVDPLPSAIID